MIPGCRQKKNAKQNTDRPRPKASGPGGCAADFRPEHNLKAFPANYLRFTRQLTFHVFQQLRVLQQMMKPWAFQSAWQQEVSQCVIHHQITHPI